MSSARLVLLLTFAWYCHRNIIDFAFEPRQTPPKHFPESVHKYFEINETQLNVQLFSMTALYSNEAIRFHDCPVARSTLPKACMFYLFMRHLVDCDV